MVEGFADVDVAESADKVLVHEGGFDGCHCLFKAGMDVLGRKKRI